MKTKILIAVIGFFIFGSCSDPGGDPIYEGFTIDFSNNTNIEYVNTYIYIGGMLNDVFTVTDSIRITPKIKIGGNNPFYFINNNRWKPNLDKIRVLPSDNCYFMLKLTESRKEILYSEYYNKPISLRLPHDRIIEGDYGAITIAIWNDRINAGVGPIEAGEYPR